MVVHTYCTIQISSAVTTGTTHTHYKDHYQILSIYDHIKLKHRILQIVNSMTFLYYEANNFRELSKFHLLHHTGDSFAFKETKIILSYKLSLQACVPHNLYYKEDPILSACLFISAYKLMVGRT